MYAAPLRFGQVERQGWKRGEERRGEEKRIASSRSCVSGRPQHILLIYEERVSSNTAFVNLMGGIATYSILLDGSYGFSFLGHHDTLGPSDEFCRQRDRFRT
jgi:hypothetical protein